MYNQLWVLHRICFVCHAPQNWDWQNIIWKLFLVLVIWEMKRKKNIHKHCLGQEDFYKIPRNYPDLFVVFVNYNINSYVYLNHMLTIHSNINWVFLISNYWYTLTLKIFWISGNFNINVNPMKNYKSLILWLFHTLKKCCPVFRNTLYILQVIYNIAVKYL